MNGPNQSVVQPLPVRRIWLVADDYGISASVNAAIRDLLARGRINATSVMVVAPTFDREQAELLSRTAAAHRIALGLHLTLTAPFRPLSWNYRPTQAGTFFPLGRTAMAALLRRLRADALSAEITAQIQGFSAAFGRLPDFVDGHQHVHLFPRIRDSVLAVVKSAAPNAWMRQCGSASLSRTDTKGWVLDVLSRRFQRLAEAAGVRVNPAFAGTYNFDANARYADLFPGFLSGLPDGSVVMCHPGIVDGELSRLDPLTTLREREYEFFGGDSFPSVLATRRVALF